LLPFQNGIAQPIADSTVVNVSIIDNFLHRGPHLQYQIDSNNRYSVDQLPEKWKKFSTLKRAIPLPTYWYDKSIYVRFKVFNPSQAMDTLYFFPGISYKKITLFQQNKSGKFIQQKDENKYTGYQPLYIPAQDTTVYIVQLKNAKTIVNSLILHLITKDYIYNYQNFFKNNTRNNRTAGFLFSGVLLMMMFFSGSNFWVNRKTEFLYNACYSFCMFSVVFFNTYFDKSTGIVASIFNGYAGLLMMITGTIFYVAFTRKFLDTKINYPILNKVFFYFEGTLCLLMLLFTYVYFFVDNYPLQSFVENTMKILSIGIGIFYIIVAAFQKNKLMNYLALGNLMLIIFSIISYILVVSNQPIINLFTSSLFYYELGIVIELNFFLIGLMYKNKLDLIVKIKEQETLKRASEKQLFESKLAIMNAKQNERNRISADMHDDLGSGVTAIRLYSELAKNRMGDTAFPEVDKISQFANDLLNNMNAIIWTMNSNNDSLDRMIAYIRNYILEYFENTGINCKIELIDNIPILPVSGEIRRNIFLVVKESINNIIKHSGATAVTMKFWISTEGFHFTIHDNGKGINLEKLRQFGNGLKNMKKRMDDSGIEFSIENNSGTLITLFRKTPINDSEAPQEPTTTSP
jgi:signal transduction histidine kinase